MMDDELAALVGYFMADHTEARAAAVTLFEASRRWSSKGEVGLAGLYRAVADLADGIGHGNHDGDVPWSVALRERQVRIAALELAPEKRRAVVNSIGDGDEFLMRLVAEVVDSCRSA